MNTVMTVGFLLAFSIPMGELLLLSPMPSKYKNDATLAVQQGHFHKQTLAIAASTNYHTYQEALICLSTSSEAIKFVAHT